MSTVASDSVAYTRSFDQKLLRWELEHGTVTHSERAVRTVHGEDSLPREEASRRVWP